MEFETTLKALIHRPIYFTTNKQGCKSIFKPNDMEICIDRWRCWQTPSTVWGSTLCVCVRAWVCVCVCVCFHGNGKAEEYVEL